MSITVNGTNGLTFNDGSAQNTAATGFGFKNRIINGACAINQRASSLATNNTQGYFVDRMWGFSSSTTCTFSQGSSSGLAGFPYFMRAQRNSGQGAGGGYFMGQIVESNNLQDLQGQSVTISFWARAGANYSATSNVMQVYLRTGTVADQGLNQLIAGWTGSVDQSSPVTLTTSWQYFTKTFSVASNVQELSAFFNCPSTGTAGANDYFDVTGFQLEKGSTATAYDYRPYGTELALCQRYYEIGGFWFQGGGTPSSNGTSAYFAVNKRTTPSITFSNTAYTNGNSLTNYTPSISGYNTLNNFAYYFIPTGNGGFVTSNWAASAEL